MKRLWASIAALAGCSIIAVLAIVACVDLDRGDKIASVVGAITAVAALCISVWQLLRKPKAALPKVVASGEGAIAAGGNVTGNAIGNHSSVTGIAVPSGASPPTPPANVHAHGDRSVASANSIENNAIGEYSRRGDGDPAPVMK